MQHRKELKNKEKNLLLKQNKESLMLQLQLNNFVMKMVLKLKILMMKNQNINNNFNKIFYNKIVTRIIKVKIIIIWKYKILSIHYKT